MATDLIHDRGRGPEIVGTRITVYNLLPDLLDETMTEGYLCRLYHLTAEQVAAARAYILCHPDTVLAEHLQIEQRMAAGNPPEVIEQMKRTHETFVAFRQWLDQRDRTEAQEQTAHDTGNASAIFPSFREWLAQQDSRSDVKP